MKDFFDFGEEIPQINILPMIDIIFVILSFFIISSLYLVRLETIPVNLPNNRLKQVMDIALRAHKKIGCSGVTRSDFKYFKRKFYLLEINTQPGMTKLSLVPEIAAYKGISFLKLIQWILKDAKKKK